MSDTKYVNYILTLASVWIFGLKTTLVLTSLISYINEETYFSKLFLFNSVSMYFFGFWKMLLFNFGMLCYYTFMNYKNMYNSLVQIKEFINSAKDHDELAGNAHEFIVAAEKLFKDLKNRTVQDKRVKTVISYGRYVVDYIKSESMHNTLVFFDDLISLVVNKMHNYLMKYSKYNRFHSILSEYGFLSSSLSSSLSSYDTQNYNTMESFNMSQIKEYYNDSDNGKRESSDYLDDEPDLNEHEKQFMEMFFKHLSNAENVRSRGVDADINNLFNNDDNFQDKYDKLD